MMTMTAVTRMQHPPPAAPRLPRPPPRQLPRRRRRRRRRAHPGHRGLSRGFKMRNKKLVVVVVRCRTSTTKPPPARESNPIIARLRHSTPPLHRRHRPPHIPLRRVPLLVPQMVVSLPLPRLTKGAVAMWWLHHHHAVRATAAAMQRLVYSWTHSPSLTRTSAEESSPTLLCLFAPTIASRVNSAPI